MDSFVNPSRGRRRNRRAVLKRSVQFVAVIMVIFGMKKLSDSAETKINSPGRLSAELGLTSKSYQSPEWLTNHPLRNKSTNVNHMNVDIEPHKRGWNGGSTPLKKVLLRLDLPGEYDTRPEFKNEGSTFKRFGFDLRRSNKMAVDRTLPDIRSEACQMAHYPPPSSLPKVSVIIIYYNEPLSTLLRNVMSVINNSPPEVLGEIVLIDDNSTLDELSLLQTKLESVVAQTGPGLIRSFHRNTHDGIVGARIRGAREAKYDVLLFLDSHCETTPGWLEPLVSRIHEDPTRVVIPSVRSMSLDELEIDGSIIWPPSKGTLSWRLNYSPVTANIEEDLLDPMHPYESPIRTAVMPGGLFAVNRDFFFDIGLYDPELKYYGAEHVDLSLRVWQCGGSLEVVPCSHVGHIFRNFNRFDAVADPLLSNIDVGEILYRNDARIAAVWMDEYNTLFTQLRSLEGIDLGKNINQRYELKQRKKCKPFQHFLVEANSKEFYVPDAKPRVETFSIKASNSSKKRLCLTAATTLGTPPEVQPCTLQSKIDPWDQVRGLGATKQLWSFTSSGHIQTSFFMDNKNLMCLRLERLHLTSCDGASKWDFESNTGMNPYLPKNFSKGEIIKLRDSDWCMQRRINLADSSPISLATCSASLDQLWRFEAMADDHNSNTLGNLVGNIPSWGNKYSCIDNLQNKRGGFGYGQCHRGATQQWRKLSDGRIQSATNSDVCISVAVSVGLSSCTGGDIEQMWLRRGNTFRPVADKNACLAKIGDHGLHLTSCGSGESDLSWISSEPYLNFSVGVDHRARYN